MDRRYTHILPSTWHAALGGRVVLVRHMLGGIIKGDEKIYKLDFRLLRKRAVDALSNCANIDIERSGAPSAVAVPGGYHWTVCWTRAAAAQPLVFLRELEAALDPLDHGVGAGAGASGGGSSSTWTADDFSQARAPSPRVLTRFIEGVAAARAAAVHATKQFAPFVALTLGEDAANLIALDTSEAEEAATALIKRDATALYLQDVFDGRTIAQVKELLDTALVTHTVKDVGGDGVPGDAVAGVSALSLGGFSTEERLVTDVSTLRSSLHEACSPRGKRSSVYPYDREVLLARLIQSMDDRGEVFAHVPEYCLYLVLVYERTGGSRTLVGAYVGSAGGRDLSYLDAYERRTGQRNRSIMDHEGKGDSNLSAFLASKRKAVDAGKIERDAVDLVVLKVGFRPPADVLPVAFGGAALLGLWAETTFIEVLWPYVTCLN